MEDIENKKLPDSERVQSLKERLVDEIGGGLDPHEHRLTDLVHRYLKNARRLVTPGKRSVTCARGFWDAPLAARNRDRVQHLIRSIEEGADLSPHLSTRAHTPTQHDGDFALAAWDVHHLHFDPIEVGKARSKKAEDELLFAIFAPTAVLLVMVGDHKSFHDGTLEAAAVRARADTDYMVIRGVVGPARSHTPLERTRMGLRGMNAAAEIEGKTVVSTLVNLAGSSIQTLRMADAAVDLINEVDRILDNVGAARAVLGPDVSDAPCFEWHFDHVELLLYEASTSIAFRFRRGSV